MSNSKQPQRLEAVIRDLDGVRLSLASLDATASVVWGFLVHQDADNDADAALVLRRHVIGPIHDLRMTIDKATVRLERILKERRGSTATKGEKPPAAERLAESGRESTHTP